MQCLHLHLCLHPPPQHHHSHHYQHQQPSAGGSSIPGQTFPLTPVLNNQWCLQFSRKLPCPAVCSLWLYVSAIPLHVYLVDCLVFDYTAMFCSRLQSLTIWLCLYMYYTALFCNRLQSLTKSLHVLYCLVLQQTAVFDYVSIIQLYPAACPIVDYTAMSYSLPSLWMYVSSILQCPAANLLSLTVCLCYTSSILKVRPIEYIVCNMILYSRQECCINSHP